MASKKVSIIIPVYNSENTINYCLDSIKKQDYENFEVIIIDDGSTDKSPTICKKYVKEDKRFKYIHKSNGGVSSARNEGLKYVTGYYTCFIDADDTISFNYISFGVKNIEENRADIFATRFNIIDGYPYDKMNTIYNKYQLLDKESFLVNLVNGRGLVSGVINKIYKSSLLNNIEFPKICVGEDLCFNFLLADRCSALKIVFSDSKLYNYFISSDTSVMHNKFSKKNLDIIVVYKHLLDYTKNKYENFNNAIKKSFVFIYMKLIMKMIAFNNYDKAIFDDGLKIIKEYRWDVYFSRDYSLKKKLFLINFYLFRKFIINSYFKNNLWKKMCIYLNNKVG